MDRFSSFSKFKGLSLPQGNASGESPKSSSGARAQSKLSIGSEVLQRLFENGKSPLSGQFLRWKLWAHWQDVVGDSMASQTEPVWFDRGVLYLWVNSSVWMQQLIFMREHIRVKINSYLHQNFVREIKFTMDRRDVPTGAYSEELRSSVSKLEDTEG